MPYAEVEARQEVLDALAEATDALGASLAALGAAYEQLDEQQGDRLEEELFRPVQRAYGRAKRTYGEFAARYQLEERPLTMPAPGLPSTGVKGFVENAVEEAERAERELVALQESDVAIDVGDPELRSGLAEVRRLIDGLLRHAREFLRSFGR